MKSLEERKKERDEAVKRLVRKSKKRSFAKRAAECRSVKYKWKLIKEQGVCKDLFCGSYSFYNA